MKDQTGTDEKDNGRKGIRKQYISTIITKTPPEDPYTQRKELKLQHRRKGKLESKNLRAEKDTFSSNTSLCKGKTESQRVK